MIVLGAYGFTFEGQRQLAAGVSLDLPLSRFAPRILARAKIGDLMWVKEPWALLRSRQFGPQNIREAVVGPAGTPPPARLKHLMRELRLSPQPALTLERGDSRATLEIMGISEHAVRVLVHMVQVDALMAARRSA